MYAGLSDVAFSIFLLQSHNCSLSYRPCTNWHDLEASWVVYGHSEKFIDRRYAVFNSVHIKPVHTELGFGLLRALSSKIESVGTNQSVIFNCLRTGNFNDNRQSYVVSLERTTWLGYISTTTPIWRLRLVPPYFNRQELSNEPSNSQNRRSGDIAPYFRKRTNGSSSACLCLFRTAPPTLIFSICCKFKTIQPVHTLNEMGVWLTGGRTGMLSHHIAWREMACIRGDENVVSKWKCEF